MTLNLLPPEQADLVGEAEAPARRRRKNAGASRTSDRRGAKDFIVTTRWAIDALLEREVFPGPIWEPACGNGAISTAFEEAGYQVFSTDLVDRGYGQGGLDFLKTSSMRGAASIVTNPPFVLASEFAFHAVELGARKVAMISRLGILEGQKRGRWFQRHPPSRTWVFSRRVDMWAGDADPEGPPQVQAVAFCWLVWEAHHPPSPIGWIP